MVVQVLRVDLQVLATVMRKLVVVIEVSIVQMNIMLFNLEGMVVMYMELDKAHKVVEFM